MARAAGGKEAVQRMQWLIRRYSDGEMLEEDMVQELAIMLGSKLEELVTEVRFIAAV